MALPNVKTASLIVGCFTAGFLCAYALQSRHTFEQETAVAKHPKPEIATPAPTAMASVPPEPAAPEADERPDLPPPGNPPPGSGGKRNDFQNRFNNPAFAKAVALQQRAALDEHFAALFKQLKLSPEALEKFKDFLVEKQSTARDVMMSARAEGINPRENPEAIKNLLAQANADLDATIQSTLTPEQFQEYQDYISTLPEQNLISQLDKRLSYSGTALTSSQSEALIKLLSANAATDTNSPLSWRSMDRSTMLTTEMIQSASSFLTADQIQALQALQAEQAALIKLRGAGRPPR